MKDEKRLQQLQSVCCKSILWAAVLALFSLFISVSYSNAQSTGGRIRGTVTDASGGAVVGANVVISNEATGSSAIRPPAPMESTFSWKSGGELHRSSGPAGIQEIRAEGRARQP